MAMLFDTPPLAAGTEAQQISAVYSYLYQLSDKLNTALNSLTADNFSPDDAEAIRSVTDGTAARTQAEQANSLRSLIIKTADVVKAEMDVLETKLKTEHVAESEFGVFLEQLDATIRATADGVVQRYGYDGTINALKNDMTAFETYQTTTQAYIKTGLLYYDNNNIPVYGVAVGQDMSKATVNGQEVLARTGMMSTFTADRLSFWQGETEIAYMTGGVLHIAKAELTDSLKIGRYLIRRMVDGSMAVLLDREG